MDQNPYQPPGARIEEPRPASPDADLADRGQRLAAAILDTVLLLLILVPLMIFGGYIEAVMEASRAGQDPPIGLVLAWTAVGFAMFVAVQGYPLMKSGQTWGKKIMGIRIVDLAGGQPSLTHLLTRRYLPVQAVSVIPVVGGLLGLVNVLLIFRGDRRCGHDLIAGTRVVKGN
jgi:uncharacterized RDD family membrane protein YckC